MMVNSLAMLWLIVARAVQGIGAGSILGLTQIVISDIVSLQERGKYAGFIGATVLPCGDGVDGSGLLRVSWARLSVEHFPNTQPGDGVFSSISRTHPQNASNF
jgi:hypothetical protein